MGISQLTVGELKHLLSEAEVDFRDCIEKSELAARLRETLPSMPARARDRLDALLSQVGAVSLAQGASSSEDSGAVTAVNSTKELMAEERNTVELFERCSRSVVHITTTVQVQRGGFSMDILDIPQGSGSGFVWDKQGHLVTNFHVPESSLLMLVGAFAGTRTIMDAYAHGVAQHYRFFSYGDVMFCRLAG